MISSWSWRVTQDTGRGNVALAPTTLVCLSLRRFFKTSERSGSAATMLWVFLLLVFPSSGADDGTLCTSDACYTLHMVEVSFNKAASNCFHNGGYLMTVRDPQEEDVLRTLLSRSRDRARKFWIGLKLHKGDCVLAGEPLRGFKWVSGEAGSSYSNWEKEPVYTCMERCVRLSYSVTGELKWVSGTCRIRNYFICKFYFRGMCKALTLLGSGLVAYTAPFSEEPLKSTMESLPLGTYANITCGDHQGYKSVCAGTDQWTIPGPFCKQESCAANNGGCEHGCHPEAEGVRCSCGDGYDLDGDGFSCRTRDRCAGKPCEHRCAGDGFGFSCECEVGFRLDANNRSCSDVDECQSQACPGQICVNTPGGYSCECEAGFKMADGECTDVDECRDSRCAQKCWNTFGSFSCACDEGFALARDDYSCEDVDACKGCVFDCVRTDGGYVCTCPRHFHLTPSGHACVPDGVVPDAPPENITELPEEVQHLSTVTDVTPPDPRNSTRDGNATSAVKFSETVNTKVLVCVLGSVLPLLLLVAATVAIAIYRCRLSEKEAKKNVTTDGYCWVSSGLDPRLEKLYESILTDDL